MSTYEKYKNISFKEFERFMHNHWTCVYAEFIAWYIANLFVLEANWELWRPYIIYNVILPTLEEKECREREIVSPIIIPESWTWHRWPGD